MSNLRWMLGFESFAHLYWHLPLEARFFARNEKWKLALRILWSDPMSNRIKK